MEIPKIIRLKATTSDGKCAYTFYKDIRTPTRAARKLTSNEQQAIVDATGCFEAGLYPQAKEILETADFIVDMP